MILGLGSDLMDIPRIEKTLKKFGARFEERIFTQHERELARRRGQKAGPRIMACTYAKRFAAKEACAKALGTGLNHGTYWRDMEVVNLPSGQPTLKLSGQAARHLQRLIPAGKTVQISLTMTDDYPLAQAVVIISAY